METRGNEIAHRTAATQCELILQIVYRALWDASAFEISLCDSNERVWNQRLTTNLVVYTCIMYKQPNVLDRTKTKTFEKVNE